MNQLTVLIGGTNGYGINDVCMIICRLFSHLGYSCYLYNDFPSVIKGQHQFAIVRASTQKIAVHSNKPDVVLALDQDAVALHKRNFKEETIILYDSDQVETAGSSQPGVGLPLSKILKENGATPDMRSSCLVGALCKILKIDWDELEWIIKEHHPSKIGVERSLMRAGFDLVEMQIPFEKTGQPVLPVLNGCQAISLGLLKAGLGAYAAYPMTPTSPILEYFAGLEKELGLQVVLPESETAVIMTALGYSYMGVKNAVGTSGGGFSLMVEGLGLSGMSELPVVVVMGQRTGPSTGMPTYTAQTDLFFVLYAGHGEFPRFVVAPGDAEEAYYWSGIAMNKAWKYRMPAIILVDKTLCLGTYSFDITLSEELVEENPVDLRNLQDLAAGQVIKANSYLHDEMGYAREHPELAKSNADRLVRKEAKLAKELEAYQQVKTYGEGTTALLCWGSNKGACIEVAQNLGLKVIQMLVLAPFPQKAVAKAVKGVGKLISMECNAKGQLASLMAQNGFPIQEKALKYDGRPFSVEELEAEVKKVMK
jgi:2-oxoglutarate/2-oxoacid ferredoxin oxidoreductase subunit alpha